MKRFLVAALAVVSPAHADVICDWFHPELEEAPCSPPRTAAQTADDAPFFQSFLNANPGRASFLVDELDADIQFNAGDMALPASTLRRFVNAAILLDTVIGPDGEHWLEWVTDWSACIWFMDFCAVNGESNGLGSVALSPEVMHRHNPVQRAGVIVHEAGHFFEAHSADDDECAGGASCDEAYGDDGPQTNHIDFLMDAKAQLDNLPDPAWEEVRGTINDKLNTRFQRHAGFNLARPNSVYTGAFRTVGFDVREGWTQATFFPDPDQPPAAITGVGLTVADDQVVRLQLRTQRMNPDGTLVVGTINRNVGLQPTAAIEREVLLPAGYVATGLKVKATADAVTHLGLVGRQLVAQPGGVLVNEITVWANNQSAVPETEFLSSSMHFLTGLGLRMQDGNLTVHAFKESLARGYTLTAGGVGGTLMSRDCGSTDRVIGVSAAVGGVGADASVDFFGLICARRADVLAGMAPGTAARSVMYTSYFDEVLQQERPGGGNSYAQMASLGPADKYTAFCPAGSAVERIAVYHNNLVRKVSWFACTDGSVVSMNQGNAQGTYTHLACDADPVTGAAQNLVVNGLRARSGWRLDALTLHCTQD